MTSRPAAEGVLRHVIYMSNAYTDSDVSTFWTYKAGAPSGARVDYEHGAIIAWLTASWRGVTTPDVSASRLVTWDHQTAPPVAVKRTLIFPAIPGTNSGGGGTGEKAPRAVNAVIALRTQPVGSAIRNRLNGRIFHPGLSSSEGQANRVIGDTISGSGITAFQNAYNALRDRLKPTTDANSGTWSVVSWRTAAGWRVAPVIVSVDHCLCRAQVGVQRRRMPRPGPYARGA